MALLTLELIESVFLGTESITALTTESVTGHSWSGAAKLFVLLLYQQSEMDKAAENSAKRNGFNLANSDLIKFAWIGHQTSCTCEKNRK